ncbi:hypothetical protein [Arenibacter sp. F20364]|nr:hypothetical protein [Arenibacter sp. F20364]MCK0190658.1 hypothetical protein [Arenibacter sp. F20364]
MTKEIKIIDSDNTPKLEKIINHYLKEGWKIRGNLIKGSYSFVVVMERKF